MKTAIILSGEFRTGLRCFPSIERHLLSKVGDYDVFAFLGRDADSHGVDVYNPKAVKVVDQPTLPEKNYIHRSGRQLTSVQANLRQMWLLEQSYDYASSMATEDYDWVIRLRPDLEFLSDVEPLETLAKDAVYIPRFCNWWGYNDRFAIISGSWAETYHRRYSTLDSYIAQGGIFHPETYLKWTLREADVRRTSVVFDTLREDGSRVSPEFYESCGDSPCF